MRESRKKIEQPGRLRLIHLGPKLPLEGSPGAIVLGRLREGHQFGAWRKIRQPDIIEVTLRDLLFWHAARRPSNSPEPNTFVTVFMGSKSHDSDRQVRNLRFREMDARRKMNQMGLWPAL